MDIYIDIEYPHRENIGGVRVVGRCGGKGW